MKKILKSLKNALTIKDVIFLTYLIVWLTIDMSILLINGNSEEVILKITALNFIFIAAFCLLDFITIHFTGINDLLGHKIFKKDKNRLKHK